MNLIKNLDITLSLLSAGSKSSDKMSIAIAHEGEVIKVINFNTFQETIDFVKGLGLLSDSQIEGRPDDFQSMLKTFQSNQA